jgi:hypothetical protein
MHKTYLQRTHEKTRPLIQELAERDGRTVPAEIHWLAEKELAARSGSGVFAIQDLPHPEGGETVPLVLVTK